MALQARRLSLLELVELNPDADIAMSMDRIIQAAGLSRAEAVDLPAVVDVESNLTEDQRRKALAKADLVRLYTEALAKAPRKGQAGKEFIAAYRGGVWPKIKEILGDKVSVQSVERWKTAMRRTGSALALADTRGGVRMEPVVTERHAQILLALARHPNKPNLAETCRMAREAFKPGLRLNAMLASPGQVTLSALREVKQVLDLLKDMRAAAGVAAKDGAPGRQNGLSADTADRLRGLLGGQT